MELIRKVIGIGNSKGMTIPKTWELLNGKVKVGDHLVFEIKKVVRNFNKESVQTSGIKHRLPIGRYNQFSLINPISLAVTGCLA